MCRKIITTSFILELRHVDEIMYEIHWGQKDQCLVCARFINTEVTILSSSTHYLIGATTSNRRYLPITMTEKNILTLKDLGKGTYLE